MDEIHLVLKKVVFNNTNQQFKLTDNVQVTTRFLFPSLLLELGVVDDDSLSICDCKVVSFSSSLFCLSSKLFDPQQPTVASFVVVVKFATISLLPRSEGIESLVPN